MRNWSKAQLVTLISIFWNLIDIFINNWILIIPAHKNNLKFFYNIYLFEFYF